ncbi:MAG: cation:proton antiporter [Alphaproteobacteria bacterium]
MNAAHTFLQVCALLALALLLFAMLITIVRIAIGPSLADRVLSLDLLVTIGIGFIAVVAVRTGQFAYVDVAIALGLTGFLATVAFARYIFHLALHKSANAGRAPDPELAKDHQPNSTPQGEAE